MYEGKLRYSFIVALVIVSLGSCDQTTQQYLQNAVRSLKNLRQMNTFRMKEVADLKKATMHRRSHQFDDNVPPLSLTKGELAALYEEAVAKGETLKLDAGDNEYVDAVVHHLDEDKVAQPDSSHHHEMAHHEGASEDAGYYYYYYPIKSFLDELSSQPSQESTANNHHKPTYHHHHHHNKELTTFKPPFTYHSHHHQHNITIQSAEHGKKEAKPMEPLFMAISGFIGMALMFVVSMMVFPKLGVKPKIVNDVKKKNQLDDFARFALNAIEGRCAERFACELTKTARSFDMEDNRFYKLLKRVAPGTFGRYINNSQKYANKQLQCTAIPCDRKKLNKINNKEVLKPIQKKRNGNKKA